MVAAVGPVRGLDLAGPELGSRSVTSDSRTDSLASWNQ